VPSTIAFQGYLTDLSGNPVNDTVDLTVSLHTAPDNGTQVWTDLISDVEVVDGVYGAALGPDGTPLLGSIDFSTQLYLGVAVDGIETSPRIALAGVPYARRAAVSDAVDTPTLGDLPCAEFQIAHHNGSAWECVFLGSYIGSWIRTHCRVYFGQRDNCNSCTDDPTTWGYVRENHCYSGAGSYTTCHFSSDLGVELLGVDMHGGDVDSNDKFYIGFDCN